MLHDGSAWFLVADGRRARLLVEQRRGGDLQQPWAEEISDEDMYDPQDRPPRSSIAPAQGVTPWIKAAA